MERRTVLRAAEPGRVGGFRGFRSVAHDADLPLRLLPSLRTDSGARLRRGTAACTPIDQGRRHGAAVFLWFGVGSDAGADGIADSMEDAAENAHNRRGETGHLCRGTDGRGAGCGAWAASADTTYLAR